MIRCLLFLLIISTGFQQGKSQIPDYPDRIMLTIPGNPATSRAVSWRSVYEDTVSLGEITIADPAPSLEKNSTSVTGTFSPWEDGSQSAMGHKVIFENLKPDTKYAYRVGNDDKWSEWLQFSTSSEKTEPFSFLYFGDVQNDIKEYCSRTLRQAYTHFPDADFMLFAGDLVKVSDEENWNEFFNAGDWIFGMMPSIPTPGNHEYDEKENASRTFSKHWNQIYFMPRNGPSEKFRNRVYFIDYQGVRFVSVDSPAVGDNREDDEMIMDWLDKTLANNPHRWAVVFTHYPVYFCAQGRERKQYQDMVKVILEKHGVDIVLQGHDHTYCRGQNLSMAQVTSGNHPMYIVSVAGAKMNGLNTSFWSDRVASETQLYQYITFNGNRMSYKSYTVTGDLYDDFDLLKNKAGINRVVVSRKVTGIEQRTEIPEDEMENYTQEEIQKYQQKFGKSKTD